MIKSMKKWILYLNEPSHVAKFQNLCGLHLISTNSNGYEKITKSTNYVIKNKYFYYLFNLGSIFGDEGFLIMFFSMLLLNYDADIGRQVMLYWSIVMYIGQVMKDLYRMDRPSSPPVVILELRYIMEYGMPSTHAMAAVAVPAGLVLNVHHNIPYYIYFAILSSILWCLLISFSRIYKGVHSFADVLVGIVVAIVLVAFMSPWIEYFHNVIITKFCGIPILFITILGMATFYPDTKIWKSGRSDTYMILGSLFGVMLGSRIDYAISSYIQIVTSDGTITNQISRFLLGVVVIVGCRFLFKPLMLRVTSSLTGLDHTVEENRQQKYFELIYKCSMYSFLGVMTSLIIPRLSSALNLGRLKSTSIVK